MATSKKVMRFKTVRTITFTDFEGFLVDIVKDSKEDTYTAWLYHENYGIKESMFGIIIHNQQFRVYGDPNSGTVHVIITLDDFIGMVEYQVSPYICNYITEHMGE